MKKLLGSVSRSKLENRLVVETRNLSDFSSCAINVEQVLGPELDRLVYLSRYPLYR
jgi:hypothetical protein